MRFRLTPLQLAMLNGTFPAFNDSKEFSLRGNAVWEVGLARYGDQRFATVLAGSDRKSLLPLILGVNELPKAATAAMPSHNYTAAGYAVLRHGEGEQATWLAMKYGPHGGGHGHPDKLSFVLYSQGQVIDEDGRDSAIRDCPRPCSV